MLDSWAAITLAEKEGKLNKYTMPVEDPYRIHFAPDLHYPFQDDEIVDHIIDLARGCEIIGQIGDGLEAYGVSSHAKNPLVKHTLNDEASLYVRKFWRPIRRDNPGARLIQITGNHEQRIQRYMWKQAPALADVPGMALSKLIKAKELGIEVHPRSGLLLAGVRFKHGDVARAIGSARSEMTAHRGDGVSGHTHRCEYETLKDKEGRRTKWYSIGHACDQDRMEYLEGEPNWERSAGITLTVYPDGRIEYKEHRL